MNGYYAKQRGDAARSCSDLNYKFNSESYRAANRGEFHLAGVLLAVGEEYGRRYYAYAYENGGAL